MFFKEPSLAKMCAVLLVPSTSLSVSSSLATPVGRLSPVRPRHVGRVQVPSGPQSGVHAAEVRLRQFWFRTLDELRLLTLTFYELPPLLLLYSQEGEIRGLGAGSWRTLRTLVKRAEAAESWTGDRRLFPITIDRIAPNWDFLSQRVTGCVLSSVYNNLSSLCRRFRVELLPQRDPLLQALLSCILDRQGAEVRELREAGRLRLCWVIRTCFSRDLVYLSFLVGKHAFR